MDVNNQSLKRGQECSIIVDNQLDYETVGVISRIFLTPLLGMLSYTLGAKMVSFSRRAHSVKKHATTYKALEEMYTYEKGKGKEGKNIFEKIWTDFWLNIINCKAVRNRLKLVKKELKEAILLLDKKDVKILSIASGSARAVVETINEFKDTDTNIHVTLIDRSDEAIEYSKWLSKEYNLTNFEYIQANVESMSDDLAKFKPDIVEMVGLLDYLNDERATKLINGIKNGLSENGVLITCNVKSNLEEKFVNKVIKWRMIYRDENDLCKIILDAGFEADKTKIIYEPLRIHGLVVTKK